MTKCDAYIALLYQQQTSYHHDNQSRKSRRLYPTQENVQPMQQSNSSKRQQSFPSSNHHDKALEHLARMSITSPPVTTATITTVNQGFDVPLLGSVPLISDFNLPLPTPRIPASVRNFWCAHTHMVFTDILIKTTPNRHPSPCQRMRNVPLITNAVP